LKARHCAGKPYSRVSDIVIAVNPYQWLTELYTEQVRLYYAQKLVWETSDKDPRIGLPPHVYEVSSLCYKGLAMKKINQSILVSGESGAGKTETVKIAMNHIASVQQDPNATDDGDSSLVVNRILDSNPLLEAFGNAKTRRNDNSSRFGKYIKLQFEHITPKERDGMPRAALAGSTCEVYLLEKSRVITHDPTERVYHVFYQLLAAPEDKKLEIWSGLKDTSSETFCYTSNSPHVKIDGMEDGDHFAHVRTALEVVGIKGDLYITLFRAIAACLQMGNLTFAPNKDDEEKTDITSPKEMKDLTELIGVDPEILAKAFTERTIKTRGEEYKVPLKSDVSRESADAFAKEIYAKIFLWIVRCVNDATCAENNYKAGTSVTYGLIGLLDIFGFESFPINGFEQLCINYCNECLQAKFTHDIFQTVMEEYQSEGLNMDDIKFDDNSDVLALIEGKFGLIKQLNEECVRPKGNDEAFVSKALQSNKAAPCLIVKATFARDEFGIFHFAGPVIYKAKDFVSRNTDTLPADLQACAKVCSNEIIAKHLDNESCSNQATASAAETKAPPKRAKSSMSADTVLTKFKSQLGTLMTGLATTSSRYIRCVKPNTKKAKLVMMHVTTMEQLRSAGVIAAVTISRSAFPNRLDQPECIEQYSPLYEGKKPAYADLKAEVEDLLENTLKHMETTKKDGSIKKGFAVGKTRAYFGAGSLEFLEQERSKIWDKWAAKIQRIARGYVTRTVLIRERYERFYAASVKIQTWVRMVMAKTKYIVNKVELARLKAEAMAKAAIEKAEREVREAKELAEKLEREAKEAEEARLAAEKFEAEREEREAREAAEAKAAAEKFEAEREEREAREKKEAAEAEAKELAEKEEREAAELKERREKEAAERKAAKEKKELEEKEAKEKKELEEKEARELKAKEEKEAKELAERLERDRLQGASAIMVQCWYRCIAARLNSDERKRDLKRMKRMGKKSKKSAVRIQAIARGFIQRPKYRAALEKQKEEANLTNQLGKMEEKLKEAEDQRRSDIEDAKFKFEEEMEEYKEQLEDKLRAEAEKNNKSAAQQTLIDESGKIIEYLRKENMKLRQQCETMKKDFKSLKENNARLMEANASASASFNQLNEHAKGLNATNARLIKNVDTYKKQLVKMKEDLKNRQAFYLAEAHARVAYQKTLARIVAQVQDKSRDAQLVEDVVIWALECEAEAKSERAALENAGNQAPPGAVASAAPVKKSQKPTDSDSDSDSD
jgi:myosin-5